jgi:hypothetical protein
MGSLKRPLTPQNKNPQYSLVYCRALRQKDFVSKRNTRCIETVQVYFILKFKILKINRKIYGSILYVNTISKIINIIR